MQAFLKHGSKPPNLVIIIAVEKVERRNG